MEYLHDNLFLDTETARDLYHGTAKELSIIDFHTHLPPEQILTNHRFESLWELWLKHDHYKWRLMRACGVEEKFITDTDGETTPWEKFAAFASIMPLAIGNPVHHWAHLELKRLFGIHLTLSTDTAEEVWNLANEKLTTDPAFRVQGLLKKFNVALLCTTDDPADDLSTHQQIKDSEISTKVLPTFRLDKTLAWESPDLFNSWLSQLSSTSKLPTASYPEFLAALKARHDHFHELGCRLSDHGLASLPLPNTDGDFLEDYFLKILEGTPLNSFEAEALNFDIYTSIARWNHEKGWTTQLHLGPQRNVNSKLHAQVGPDSGFDTISTWPQSASLIEYLDHLNSEGILGKTILYHLNPAESEPLCAALQNFQSSPSDRKLKGLEGQSLLQFGPAWWHLDHPRGIRAHLDILASYGALGTFVGMLTDSRSFTSYVRHEYFRRLLCQYLGQAAEAGDIPHDLPSLQKTVTNLCHQNAKNYLNL